MYYFGYGSNMFLPEMNKYLGKKNYKIISYSYIPNYIFKYRAIDKRNLSFANTEPRKGSKTYGILYEMSKSNFSKLFNKEGFISYNNPENIYDVVEIKVKDVYSPKTTIASVFVMENDVYLEEIPPSKSYKCKVIKGVKSIENVLKKHLERINYL